ncbi:hypothetical protein [Staphylococcus kloosii]|uniref:hypothetical protein n=1 Tax=Staphylococcus kloosii TaxID=29384 RepID=UPI000D1E5034|nr:hypothetical protein [Staphylococcus kloosii]PTJ79268.1 hypothetical protein BUZ59_04360 [Staphylococcus kloosii]
MAYEYKEDIEVAVIEYYYNVREEAFDELDEVYIKAETLNEIIKVFDGAEWSESLLQDIANELNYMSEELKELGDE